jgi:hypothetical protein
MDEEGQGGGAERRAAPRYRARGPVCFTAEDVEGRGVLHDISLVGAFIEDASPRLKAGTRIELRFSPRPDCLPIRVKAEVKRETETGFGVEARPRGRRGARPEVSRPPEGAGPRR